jgi:segregation and condensation protein A
MEYLLKLPNFSGPIDLLFYSAKKGETDIFSISLRDVINYCIQQIYKFLEIDLESIAEFLIYSASLLELKSKKLLPQEEEEEEEEEVSEEELKKIFEEKIKEYRKYKEISESFKILEENMRKVYLRREEINLSFEEDLILEDISLFDLFLTFKKILNRTKEKFIEIPPEKITIEDKIEEIKVIIRDKKVLNFLELFSKDSSKIEVIVTFLAILELIRQKFIKIKQTRIFGEIKLYLNDGETGI